MSLGTIQSKYAGVSVCVCVYVCVCVCVCVYVCVDRCYACVVLYIHNVRPKDYLLYSQATSFEMGKKKKKCATLPGFEPGIP